MDAFATLSEVAVGVAGFGPVAIVLAREECWSGSDLFRISAFLMASLGALFLSLLPIGLSQSALGEGAVWRATSASVAAQLWNVGPWGGVASATAPFFGVLWLLGFACLVLVRVLFFWPSRASGEEA